jgi:hypothetical protein
LTIKIKKKRNDSLSRALSLYFHEHTTAIHEQTGRILLVASIFHLPYFLQILHHSCSSKQILLHSSSSLYIVHPPSSSSLENLLVWNLGFIKWVEANVLQLETQVSLLYPDVDVSNQ